MQAFYGGLPIGDLKEVDSDAVPSEMQRMFSDGADEVRVYQPKQRGAGITRAQAPAGKRRAKRRQQKKARRAQRS